MKTNKPRKHMFWVLGMTCAMVLLEYIFDGHISLGTFRKSFVFALFIEFGHYCMSEYRRENENIEVS